MPTPTSASILVVDDEPSIRLALRDFLEMDGYQVHEADSGLAAMEKLQTDDLDLVITDIMMPGMKGTELMKEVLRTDPYMPFVLITAYPSIEAAIECMRTGAIDYINKPFEFSQLRRAVEMGLGKRQELMNLSQSTATRDSRIPTDYTCLRTLGQGSMGVVYLVCPKNSPRQRFALKSLHLTGNSYAEHRLAVRRFGHEIRAAQMVKHPNVVEVIDYGSTRDFLIPYVVMEYVPGHPLSFLIQHDALDLRGKLRILEKVASAIQAIHDVGILHRDIKPANILLNADLTPKLGDFGIARLPHSSATGVDDVLGSPSYMAPEAFSSKVDERSDIFSFGATAYELIEGRRLFDHDSMARVMAQIVDPSEVDESVFQRAVHPALMAFLLRCLRKQPAERFQTARDLLEAIRDL